MPVTVDTTSNSGASPLEGSGNANYKQAQSIYDFTAVDIDGNTVSLDRYRGNVCIIVNVAILLISVEFVFKGLKILGFPCNQVIGNFFFGSQEPGTNSEIKTFAANYNVKFDMFAKIDVNGDSAHPLWKYLKKKQGGTLTDGIKWNFTKFIVDKNGQPVARHATTTDPFDMEKDLLKYLNQ
ncbi:hypothetical protein GHT06_007840 [Daphnia sinensis]|uniref:Glutathione peroxidase n=1 Tax=Daphnia sinensis TaxID=1820382 RepID=A0AAD5L0Z3_9CRUS|nr:hypothetical protein GHT06_007840 [Daphnia sinensis]